MIEVKKIGKYIYSLQENYHKENVISYLFVGNKESLLIDTGMGIFSIKDVVGEITETPVSVINTHFHFDHIGGNHEFENIYAFNNGFIKKAQKGFELDQIISYYEDDQFVKKPAGFDIKDFSIKPFKVSKFVSEGFRVNIEPFCFEIIHTPGHSQDSICLYEENRGFLVSGDILYSGPIFVEDLASYRNSINKLQNYKISLILPGHNNNFLEPEIIDIIENKLNLVKCRNTLELKINKEISIKITETFNVSK